MKFIWIVIFSLLFLSFSYAQKYDRNWVFGYNCGIDFNDLNNPRVFETNIDQCYATAASISDSSGNLILYLGKHSTDFSIEMFDSEGTRIDNSDIILSNSYLNGAFFLPHQTNREQYYLIYTGSRYNNPNCDPMVSLCANLYYSLIDVSLDSSRIIQKDIPLGTQDIFEGINAVKHSNGRDWWIIARELPKVGTCTNTYITFLLTTDGFKGPFSQDIGPFYCDKPSDPDGSITISKYGNKLSFYGTYYQVLELFDFDRCEGELFNYKNLDSNKLSWIYDCEFSPNSDFLYVNTIISNSSPYSSKLMQFDLNNNDKITIWSDSSIGLNDFTLTQLKLAPDNKIYVSYSQRDFRLTKFNQYNNHLSFINFPNRKGTSCDFNPFEFELADSSYAFLALPHMPNYNLGPTGIYKADAGNDTLLCKSYMNGVKLGTPAIAGLSYSWSPTKGLDNSSIAQPTANPDSNMKYTLTITDDNTTSSCNQRKDSVFVKVETCTSINDISSNGKGIVVYPNPTQNILHIETTSENHQIQNIQIIDIGGKNIIHSKQSPINTSELSPGIYFYQVEISGGELVRDKFVKN